MALAQRWAVRQTWRRFGWAGLVEGSISVDWSGHLGGIFVKVGDLLTFTKCIQAGGGEV